MKKLLLLVFAGIVVVGGVIAYFTMRDPGTPKTNDTKKSSVTLNFETPLCDQIPASVAEAALGKKIVNTKTLSGSTTNACQYYIDETHFVTLRLNQLSYENQKRGQQALDRTITTNDQIHMEHFVAVQTDGLINDIVLKIEDGLILAVDRSSGSAITEDNIVALAAKVADYLKTGGGNTSTATTTTVPKPQEEDIFKNFFQLIEDKKVTEAVLAMSAQNTDDDSTKQAWGVQFNRMNSVKVVSLEPSMQSSWTATKHSYKVVLDVMMDPSSADAPIPYYGYENGQNVRFVTIVSENNLWKIDGIATGP